MKIIIITVMLLVMNCKRGQRIDPFSIDTTKKSTQSPQSIKNSITDTEWLRKFKLIEMWYIRIKEGKSKWYSLIDFYKDELKCTTTPIGYIGMIKDLITKAEFELILCEKTKN